jgi:hypothetical protein
VLVPWKEPVLNSRALAVVLGILAVVFLVLNFVVDAGTVFLILAAAAAVGCVVMLSRARRR